MRALRPLFGQPELDTVQIDYMGLVRKMATVIPTINAASEVPGEGIREAVSLVVDGKLDVGWMVTPRAGLADAPRAYAIL
jgi:threonine dehydrogenase-like Zn-dependent dehydrogenase